MMFKYICEQYKIGDGFKLHQHMLRHTFATRCIEAGMPASVLAKIMEEKTNLFNQNQNLIIQRDCYLARLMSGKLSVEGKEIV